MSFKHKNVARALQLATGRTAPAAASDSRSRQHRFAAFDGLRAWLACSVVLTHAIFLTSIDTTSTAWHVLRRVGDFAVLIFVIMSGFVIAGLLLEKREKWLPFMVGRLFRIYPIYILGLALSVATVAALPAALAAASWARDGLEAQTYVNEIAATVRAHPVEHLLLHLSLLHGLVPNNVLPLSEYAFMDPAWSLSLEWQFYLIAPLLMLSLSRRWTAVAAFAALIGASVLFRLGVFGEFASPSHFAGAGFYFLVGMVTRTAIAQIRRAPLWLAFVPFAIGPLFPFMLAIGAWGIFLSLMLRAEEGAARAWFKRAFDALFLSAPVQWLGLRSYGVYILHWPIMTALTLVLPLAQLTPAQACVILFAGTIALTIPAAALIYVTFEAPLNALGGRLRRRIMHRAEPDPAPLPKLAPLSQSPLG